MSRESARKIGIDSKSAERNVTGTKGRRDLEARSGQQMVCALERFERRMEPLDAGDLEGTW